MKAKAHDIRAALAPVATGTVSTQAEDEAAFPRLSTFDDGAVYVGRFSGESPWERHPGGDEFLYVLEGEVEITLLGEPEPTRTMVPAGSVFVVPSGVWHKQLAKPSVTLLALVPDDSEISHQTDPHRR